MQLSHRNRNRISKTPRHSRRGALMPAALLAVLVITILLGQFASVQLRHASAARSEARAVWLAAIAADFDYYVHKNRVGLANRLTEANSAGRKLTALEKEAFEDYLRADLARQMPGFTLAYLVGHIAEGNEVFGGLLLGTSGTNGVSETEIDKLVAKLATYGAQANRAEDDDAQDNRPQDRVLDRDQFVRNVLRRDLTGSERVILTAPLSGINPKYVLRMRRAGHPPPKLVGVAALDMDGHNLKVKNLAALGGGESAAETVILPRLDARDMTGTLLSVGKTPETPDAINTGNVGIGGTTHVGKTLTVEHPVVTKECTGC